MNRLPVALAPLATFVLLAGCGTAASSQLDPQQPLPAGRADAPSKIVICPDGSSYDPAHNVCLATGVQTSARSGPPVPAASTEADADLSVGCAFPNGWVAVLPVDRYPQDDSFLMQALIGMNQAPDFWANESDYADLRPYAARRCTTQPQRFQLAPGSYYVLAGQTGTYARRGAYGQNGFKRRVEVSPSSPPRLTIESTDLNHTWECISCPFVAFLHPQSGHWRPAFVILAHRAGAARRGTDRYVFENIAVHHGRIRLRIVEAEQEVSRIDQLVLRVHGQTLLPAAGGAHSALGNIDGIDVQLAMGQQVEVDYEVPGVVDSAVTAELVAHGHYDPIEP